MLHSVPGTNKFKAMKVKFLSLGNNEWEPLIGDLRFDK